MPVIPLVLSDSPTLISSLLRLSAHHLALAASPSQPLKSGTLSLYLSVPVPVLIPSVVTSRPAGLPLYLTPLLLRLRFGFADHCARLQIIFTYLLTYLHTDTDMECINLRAVGPRGPVGDDTVAGAWQSAIVDLVRPQGLVTPRLIDLHRLPSLHHRNTPATGAVHNQ